MARTKKATGPVIETTPSVTRRAPVNPERKRTPVRRKSVATSSDPVVEFDPTAHYDEIAASAYLNFLARAGAPGNPEEDWLLAEATVRALYTS